jgi:hypothetical protein
MVTRRSYSFKLYVRNISYYVHIIIIINIIIINFNWVVTQ